MKKRLKFLAVFMVIALLCGSSLAYAVEPVANDFVKTSAQNQLITFKTEDFTASYVDMNGKQMDKIKFISLPGLFGEGKLLLKGEKVKKNQEISLQDVDSLCFQPKKNFVGEVNLKFVVSNGEDYSNRSTMTIIVNGAAVQETVSQADKSVTVYENSPKSFCVVDGVLRLADKKVKLIIKPTNGTVDIADKQTGEVVYTPMANYVGDDKFAVRIKDIYGNEQTASVNVMVADNTPASSVVATNDSQNPVQIVYSDLNNHWAEYSALKLAQNGVIVGEKLKNNTAFFHPEEVMNRAEFYNMLLASIGARLEDGQRNLKMFADCKEEPEWVMQTAQTAYQKGLLSGCESDGTLYFKPYDILTRAEAAVILNHVINPKTATCVETNYRDINSVPSWAVQSVKNMTSCGIFKGNDENFSPEKAVTRAESAELCYQALRYEKDLQK